MVNILQGYIELFEEIFKQRGRDLMDRIKDLYQANEITDNGQLIGLQKWYNRVIMKQPDELDLKDVSIMIRQRLFIETAVNKAVTFLEEDPLVGEMYPGQLLINLSRIPSSDYVQYRGKLLRIIDNALECIVINDDITGEEKDDILTSIRKINDTLMENTKMNEILQINKLLADYKTILEYSILLRDFSERDIWDITIVLKKSKTSADTIKLYLREFTNLQIQSPNANLAHLIQIDDERPNQLENIHYYVADTEEGAISCYCKEVSVFLNGERVLVLQ